MVDKRKNAKRSEEWRSAFLAAIACSANTHIDDINVAPPRIVALRAQEIADWAEMSLQGEDLALHEDDAGDTGDPEASDDDEDDEDEDDVRAGDDDAIG